MFTELCYKGNAFTANKETNTKDFFYIITIFVTKRQKSHSRTQKTNISYINTLFILSDALIQKTVFSSLPLQSEISIYRSNTLKRFGQIKFRTRPEFCPSIYGKQSE